MVVVVFSSSSKMEKKTNSSGLPFLFSKKKCLSPPFHVLIRVYVNVGCFYMLFLFFFS